MPSWTTGSWSQRGLSNYWGYNTLCFFAPEARYAVDVPLDSFRATVSRLHDAGIEVILDVVYNHTCEGNHLGPTLSFRGIDNTSYYWLSKEAALLRELHRHRQRARPDASARPADGDGFAALLGGDRAGRRVPLRSRHHARPRTERLRSGRRLLRCGPAGSGAGPVKLIAEPWDVGLGGYQVGHFPPGWSEWNDHFRRTLRRYWTSDGNVIGDVGGRMTASTDLFNHDGRSRAPASITSRYMTGSRSPTW